MSNDLSGPHFRLNSGYKIPAIGFGLWKVPTDKAASQVYNAIKVGYRALDGAQCYGNEKQCGEGLKKAIDEGIIKREDVFITTKVWNTFHEPEHVKEAIEISLSDWGVDYFDMVLVHWPIALRYVDPKKEYPAGFYYTNNKIEIAKVPLHKTWGALEDAVEEGKTKSIGIANYTAPLVQDCLSYAKIKPAVIQIELHPYLNQERFVRYLKINDIQVISYSTFGPQSFYEMDNETAKSTCKIIEHDVIKVIGMRHKKTPAQVVLRWATQKGIAVNPKSNQEERLKENLLSFNFDLYDDDIKQIDGLTMNMRFNPGLPDPDLLPLYE